MSTLLVSCKYPRTRLFSIAHACDSTQRNDRESPLLRLPGELRNHIYDYIFNEEIEFDTLACPFTPAYWTAEGMNEAPTWYTMLFICRKIYVEPALLPFTQLLVVYDVHLLESVSASFSPAQRRAIKSVRLLENASAMVSAPSRLIAFKMRGKRISDFLPGHVKVLLSDYDTDFCIASPANDDQCLAKELVEKWMTEGTGGKITVEWLEG
jgi:hypothetical protein